MHRQMLARYDAERLSLGLSPVKPFDNWEDPIQGYDCELAGFGVRPPLLKVSDDEVQWLRYQKSQATELLKKPGLTIDEYGTWVERNLHNGGHVIISKMREIVPGEMPPMVVPGVMLYVETAIRDPMFFRWHKYVDNVIEMYKQNVATPYTDADLTWSGMEVEGIEILDNRHFVTNTLETFKRTREIDLSYSIDLRQEDYDGNKVTVTHLDHNKFSYRFRVKNSTGKARWATVRVFLVPVLDESGEPYTMKEYHSKCIEMDRFTQKIDTGSRIFERASSDSSVIIPWDQSFSVLYGNIEKEQDYVQQANEDYCGCGWPEHLQIPRGKVGGMPYRVLVMLTDWEDDKVKRDRTVPVNPDDTKVYIIADNEEHKSCKNAASYCGRRDLLYPDRRDMGFPFDRPLEPETLDSFIAGRRNFNYTNLTIRHTNKVLNE